ncbi:MAG: flippase-like domain-containing protein [Acidobacteria bacterium]|nr:flippase-like domain-containing protein [Acidobacteriota bacterium]
MDHPDIPLNSTFTPARKSAWRAIKPTLGYLLAVVCLVWVFHDAHVDRLLDHITTINWWWVAVAIGFDILSYICQGLRWQLLLKPIGDPPLLRTTQAIYAGLFTNEVLPMRFGELVRAYLVSRWAYVRLVSIIPSMAVERLFDGIWLAVGIGLTTLFVPLPKNLLEARNTLGIIVLIATGLFVYAIFSKQKAATGGPPRNASRWKPLRLPASFIEHMTGGLRDIGTSRSFYMAFSLSFAFLALQALAFWLIMWGYGLRLSFWVGFVVLLIVHLGTAIPNAPANVGTYQFFTVVGLTLFGVDKTLATGFSVVVFVLLTVPLWVIGFLALSRTGMTLSEIRTEINRLRR